VKSFSLANHIHHPGFQLLSLADPSSDPSASRPSLLDTPCHLPDQYGIYFSTYGLFLAFTGIFLLILTVYKSRQLEKRIPHMEPLTISPNSSGQNTPSLDPESAIWSPYTAPVPTSPRSALPSYLRTPNAAAGPTFRASRPATPLGSPLLTPMFYPPEDEDESMYPMQYATRRDNRPREKDDEWSPEHDRISSDSQIPHFTSAPRLKHIPKQSLSWSWTFVFRGRRRRMTLAAPGPAGLYKSIAGATSLLVGKGEKNSFAAHRGVLHTAFLDGLLIIWPAAAMWVILAWWMY
jgi:hypothetical protein